MATRLVLADLVAAYAAQPGAVPVEIESVGGVDAARRVADNEPFDLVVLASDATHFYANMARRDPFPVLVDAAAVLRGFDRLEALAPSRDHIVPGHDPGVMRAYPPVPGLEGIAVRLDSAPVLGWEYLA